ncbi:MAG: thioredoxin family protein, partial [Muribaculaceae bacterium]|nr:thioredoxin family protein [Muribaculaceae bacterium]
LWIVLFILMGMYLLGKLRFSHDSQRDHVGVGSFMLALLPLSFAVYLIPGLWGAPLKAASAFVPPLTTQDFNLYAHSQEFVEFDDYTSGMEYAREHNMPVLIDFSGYGCVNCRKMEEAVINTDDVHSFIAENFVVIKLMVDAKTPLAQPITVTTDNGQITLETVGDKWMFLQNYKFGASTQPYYVILDNNGSLMNEPTSFHESPERFMTYLQQGLENYNILK